MDSIEWTSWEDDRLVIADDDAALDAVGAGVVDDGVDDADPAGAGETLRDRAASRAYNINQLNWIELNWIELNWM